MWVEHAVECVCDRHTQTQALSGLSAGNVVACMHVLRSITRHCCEHRTLGFGVYLWGWVGLCVCVDTSHMSHVLTYSHNTTDTCAHVQANGPASRALKGKQAIEVLVSGMCSCSALIVKLLRHAEGT